MKKIILILIICSFSINLSFGQYINDSRVDSIVNLVSVESITKYMKELTGDTITIIGGIPRLIFSRYYTSPANEWAAQYIFQKFQSYGLNVRYQIVDSLCKNVIAVKTGTKYPNQMYVIGAHYDNILLPVKPGPLDTVYGADDNASGICGLLEAARLISNMNLDFTVVFGAWDEEELLGHGSPAYSYSAYLRGDSIKAYLNLDMLTYNYLNQNKVAVGSDSNSCFYADLCSSVCTRYIPQYFPVKIQASSIGSDNLSFMLRGFKVIVLCEHNIYANPYIHSINDKFANANLTYCNAMIKATIATLLTLALNKSAYFEHNPHLSSPDTTGKIATAVIKFPDTLPYSNNAPRLYYRSNSGIYSYVNAFYRNLDTFKFLIPGHSSGTIVYYYFAAQDSLGNFVCTYPVGGSGVNPPGNNPPPEQFYYQIYSDYSQCSNTLPKQIIDLHYTTDTININQSNKLIQRLKVNLTLHHTDDGDIIIQLFGPGGQINLSVKNGTGGQNYINTTFDDSASVSITQGTPPFTGSFKPQNPLNAYNNKPVSFDWKLRIYDTKTGNQGTLDNWCLIFRLRNTVGIEEKTLSMNYMLLQNYPNPFNTSTRIEYKISKDGFVTLKIYDLIGREVRSLVNEKQNEGEYAVLFDASDLPSGIYFYKLATDNYAETKRMILIK